MAQMRWIQKGTSLLPILIALLLLIQNWGRAEWQEKPLSQPPVKIDQAPIALPMQQVILPPPPTLAATPVPATLPQSPVQTAQTIPAPRLKPLQPIPTTPTLVVEALQPQPTVVHAQPTLKPDANKVVVKPLQVHALKPQKQPPKPTETEPPQATVPPQTASAPTDQTEDHTPIQSDPMTHKVQRQQGRVLLKLLEHGKGPSITLRWPSQQRKALFKHMDRCQGMRSGVMDNHQRIFVQGGDRGVPWHINRDRYSGFMRLTNRTEYQENKRVDAIRLYHGLRSDALPVRLFPRGFDAVLLGGIQNLVGQNYAHAKSIEANYHLKNGLLWAENIRVDHQPITGRVALSQRRCL
ncbi:hypothetical protein [Magnetococcus sp. PR-3]|uniref:hypothetical protein n=1 Tax=Magnetococcus sp. PR-3 TaxID=3120355 RepID=UPI002FCE5414